jgi:magnesium transporter
VGLVLTGEAIVTVRKTPLNGEPFDTLAVREACRGDEPPGRLALQIAEEIADGFLLLIDKLTEEIDEVEANVEEWTNDRVRNRLSRLRSDVAKIHQSLSPTREAMWQIADNRLDARGKEEIFPKDVEIDFADVHDRLMRATEGLEFCRELLNSVREFHDSKLANDANEAAQKQSEIVSRLTIIASLLLLPALIVAIFGMALPNQPGLDWPGLWWVAVGLCAGVTVLQLWFFRKKGWF